MALVVVGSELLSGRVRDANGPYLAARLNQLGRDVGRIEILPDDVETIAESVSRLKEAFELVFVCGGVGPTHDDVTMEAVARAFGVSLYEESRILEQLRQWGWKLGGGLERLARIPEGARLLEVEGHLPVVQVQNCYVLPGVPKILRPKFEALAPSIERKESRCHTVLYRVERSELEVTDRIDEVVRRVGQRVVVGSYPQSLDPRHPVLDLSLCSRDASALERACSVLEEVFPEARRLGGASREPGERQAADGGAGRGHAS